MRSAGKTGKSLPPVWKRRRRRPSRLKQKENRGDGITHHRGRFSAEQKNHSDMLRVRKGNIQCQAGLLTCVSTAPHAFSGFPNGWLSPVRCLHAHSGGTVRESHPIHYSLRGPQQTAEHSTRFTCHDYYTKGTGVCQWGSQKRSLSFGDPVMPGSGQDCQPVE